MNFLILEGYKDAAISFSQEAGLPADLDWGLIDHRIVIRKLIVDGNIEEAINHINDYNPEVSFVSCFHALSRNSCTCFSCKAAIALTHNKLAITDT